MTTLLIEGDLGAICTLYDELMCRDYLTSEFVAGIVEGNAFAMPDLLAACKAVIDSALYRYESYRGLYWCCRLCNKNSRVDGAVDQIEHTDDCPVLRTIAAIAKAGEEGHPVEQETPCSVQAEGTAPCRLPNWFREPTEWADGTTRSIAERLAAIAKTREENSAEDA